MSITTPKKRAANRANAAKSTGPRTPEGKRQSSRNAVTHGLFCRAAILPGEDPAELERLRRGMMARLRPRDALERMLADRVVSEAWRLRRAVAFEARVIASKTIEEQAERQRYRARYADKPPLHAGQIIRSLLGADVLTKLSRYEQRIERSMYRAMAELRRLQGESLPEGEWLDTEAEDEPADEPAAAPDDADDRPAAKRRTRKTKPRPENSENDGPPAEEDEEVEDYEDEDERGRETKPRRENSENHEPLVEEDEEEEDYEDDDGGRLVSAYAL